MPPRTHCSAAMSWGGVRSKSGAAEGSSTTLIAHPRFTPAADHCPLLVSAGTDIFRSAVRIPQSVRRLTRKGTTLRAQLHAEKCDVHSDLWSCCGAGPPACAFGGERTVDIAPLMGGHPG